MNAIIKIYDALRHSGVSDENAKTISESIGEIGQEKRLTDLEAAIKVLAERMENIEKRMENLENTVNKQLNAFRSELRGFRSELQAFKSELKTQRWVFGIFAAANIAVLVQEFFK